MITRKAGPALVAGCTVVLKPSERTPLTAVALPVLAEQAGIPHGVFELVSADAASMGDVGEEMCSNTAMRKILFTGSTPVGKLLMRMSSETVKRLLLKLGGNAPFIGEPPIASAYAINLKKTNLTPNVRGSFCRAQVHQGGVCYRACR